MSDAADAQAVVMRDALVLVLDRCLKNQAFEGELAPVIGTLREGGLLDVNGTLDLAALASVMADVVLDRETLPRFAIEGDVLARRALIADALVRAQASTSEVRTRWITYAEYWAREFVKSRDPQELLILSSVLAFRAKDALENGDSADVTFVNAEAMAALSFSADFGSETAAELMTTLAYKATDTEIIAALTVRRLWDSGGNPINPSHDPTD